MNVIWGIILFVISSIGYFGQVVSTFWPNQAAKLGLMDVESDVDPTFFADGRGEAYWDSAVLWTLPLAGLLLVFDSQYWVYFGLIGGGMYLYFAGRGIVVRNVMRHRSIRIGQPESLTVAYIFLAIWGLVAAITIGMAVSTLHQS